MSRAQGVYFLSHVSRRWTDAGAWDVVDNPVPAGVVADELNAPAAVSDCKSTPFQP